jgi:hypothetical protein
MKSQNGFVVGGISPRSDLVLWIYDAPCKVYVRQFVDLGDICFDTHVLSAFILDDVELIFKKVN